MSNYLDRWTLFQTDYTRQEIESGKANGGFGCIPQECIDLMVNVENLGFVVKFRTSLLRRIFCVAKYKVIAYR